MSIKIIRPPPPPPHLNIFWIECARRMFNTPGLLYLYLGYHFSLGKVIFKKLNLNILIKLSAAGFLLLLDD